MWVYFCFCRTDNKTKRKTVESLLSLGLPFCFIIETRRMRVLPTSGVFTVFVKALPEFQAPNKTLFCSLLCLALACAHTGFNNIHHVVAKLLTL